MNIGKIFIIVLALHVVVIGGILGYHFVKSKNKDVTADLTRQNVIESAPTSIDHKPIADMDSAAIPPQESYATEIITAEAAPTTPQSAPENLTTPSPSAPATPVAPVTAASHPETLVASAASSTAVESVIAVESSDAESAPVKNDPPKETTYSVQKGDTLSKIARVNGISVHELKSINQLPSDILRIGQKLVIPSKSGHASAPTKTLGAAEPVVVAESAPVKQKTVAKTHTVQQGETLYRIAQKNHTSVSALKKANALKSETLKIGQKLTIPGQTHVVSEPTTKSPISASHSLSSSSSYTVQKGDSIYAIAKKHQVSVQDIMNANQIKDATKISVGQKIVIPPKGNASASTPKSESAPSAQEPVAEKGQASSAEAVASDTGVFAPHQLEMATNTKLD